MAAFDFSLATEPLDTPTLERAFYAWRRRAMALVAVHVAATIFALITTNLRVATVDTYLTTYGGQLIPVQSRSY